MGDHDFNQRRVRIGKVKDIIVTHGNTIMSIGFKKGNRTTIMA